MQPHRVSLQHVDARRLRDNLRLGVRGSQKHPLGVEDVQPGQPDVVRVSPRGVYDDAQRLPPRPLGNGERLPRGVRVAAGSGGGGGGGGGGSGGGVPRGGGGGGVREQLLQRLAVKYVRVTSKVRSPQQTAGEQHLPLTRCGHRRR
jgi:hypothetical protein